MEVNGFLSHFLFEKWKQRCFKSSRELDFFFFLSFPKLVTFKVISFMFFIWSDFSTSRHNETFL